MVRKALSRWMVLLVLLAMAGHGVALGFAELQAQELVEVHPLSAPESVLVPFIELKGESLATRSPQVYAVAVKTGETITLSEDVKGVDGNALSDSPSIDVRGTKAVFHSWSTNWGISVNGANVYLKDISTGALALIRAHAKAPVISPDGTYIIFEYNGNYWENPSLVLYAIDNGQEYFIAHTSGGNSMGYHAPKLAISADSRFIAFHTTVPLVNNDLNSRVDVYVYDRGTGAFSRVSDGGMNPSFTGNVLTYEGGNPVMVTPQGITPYVMPAPTPTPVIIEEEIEIKP